jgi:hypothetical protein
MLSCSLFTVYREAGERMGQVNQFIEQSSDSEEESYGDQDLAVINLDSWIALRWAQPSPPPSSRTFTSPLYPLLLLVLLSHRLLALLLHNPSPDIYM